VIDEDQEVTKQLGEDVHRFAPSYEGIWVTTA